MKPHLLVLSLLLLALCAGCAQIANPVVPHRSLEEINAGAGTHLVFSSPENATDVQYSLIANTIAEIQWKENGFRWTLRAKRGTDDDISGLYAENGTVFKDDTESVESFLYDDTYAAYRILKDGEQIVLSTDSDAVDRETFVARCQTLAADLDFDSELR